MDRVTVAFSVELVPVECANCSTIFGVMPQLYRGATETGGVSLQCPNGHGNIWHKTRVKQLEEELQVAKNDLWRVEGQLMKKNGELEESDKAIRRLRKRVAHGVCPCCRRSFLNLQLHIRHQHPEYVNKSK